MESKKAVVLRDNKKGFVASRELVPGDIIFLEAGSRVPSDARLVEVNGLEVQESALTGESVPVLKECCVLKKEEVSEQRNMVFAGTVVTKGRARAVVAATGMGTEIGRITKMISDVDETTPLQLKIDAFAKYLGFAAIIICGIIFSVTLLRGGDFI